MSAALKPPEMSADEFMLWSLDQPGDPRNELVGGRVQAMAPQTFAHGDTKFRIAQRLAEQVAANRLACRVIVDSVGVRVGRSNLFIPDVMLHGGPPPAAETREINDPLVLIEVASESTAHLDEGP